MTMKTRLLSITILLALPACSGGDGSGEDIENPGGDPGTADAANCQMTDGWDPAWAAFEDDILRIVNQRRAEGATCGSKKFSPTHPLKMDPALQCASRLHSQDMADRDFFAHDNPSGEDPWVRIKAAGFQGQASGENIAAGNNTAESTMEQWMKSDGHCSNIMSAANFIGVGYYPGGKWGHLWTQTFGK